MIPRIKPARIARTRENKIRDTAKKRRKPVHLDLQNPRGKPIRGRARLARLKRNGIPDTTRRMPGMDIELITGARRKRRDFRGRWAGEAFSVVAGVLRACYVIVFLKWGEVVRKREL